MGTQWATVRPDRSPPVVRVPARTLQRACACGARCRCPAHDKHESGREPGAGVGAVLRSPGEPLDRATRSTFEERLGHDFSRVRVHADATAAASARALDALAWTVGPHIAFAPGQFTPGTAAGRRLLAHELVHVAQQPADAASRAAIAVAPAGTAAEREADALADAAVRGGGGTPRVRSDGVVQRQQPATPSPPAPAATWSLDQISIFLGCAQASCEGWAWPGGETLLSACQPITGCKPEATFNLVHSFHLDSAPPEAPKPENVKPKQVDVHAEFKTSDDTVLFSKHVTDTAPAYDGQGARLRTTAGTGFSFKTARAGKLFIDLGLQVQHPGGIKFLSYSDIVSFSLVKCEEESGEPKPGEPGKGKDKPKPKPPSDEPIS